MTTPDLSLDELDDYLHGGSGDSEVAALEERLFASAQAGESEVVQFLDTLQRRASWLADVGQFGESYERAEVDALVARESNIEYIDFEPGGLVAIPMWKAGTRRVVFHMRVDLRGYEHVEVDGRTDSGERLITFRDVTYDRHDGNLYSVCMEPVARMALTSGRLRWQISGQRAGKREIVADFTSHVR